MSGNKGITWFLFAAFFLPLVYKAFAASFTHDEAFSYLNYAKRPVLELLLPPPHYTANNHLLNSLLMKFMSWFGSAEGLLRLPNLLAGIAWFWGVKRWFTSFQAPLVLASPLLFVPYVMDFFALARGYGLALAALLWLLILVHKEFKLHSTSFWWQSGLLSLALLWSNLSFLTPWLALVGISTVVLYQRTNRETFLRFVAAQLVAVLSVVPTLRVLIAGNQLYYGHNSNLLHWTLGYLHIPSYNHSAEPIWTPDNWELFLLLSMVLAVAGAWVHFFRMGSLLKAPLLPLFVLVLSLLGSFLQMQLFNTPYPVGRTALYVWPLVFLALAGWGTLGKQVLGVFLFLGCISMAPFAYSPKVYSEWEYDAYTKPAMHELAKEYAPGEGISHTWLLEPSMNYYRERLHLQTAVFTREGIDSTSTWILALPEEHSQVPKNKSRMSFPNGLLLVH